MKRILIADDDPQTRELIERVLQAPDVELRAVSSGAELIHALADEGPYDLVVTDVSMPWMNGLQVVRAARNAGIATPVIVITGLEGTPSIRAEAAQLGAHLLKKPIAISELRAWVRACADVGEARGSRAG